MDPFVIDTAHSTFLVGSAHLVTSQEHIADLAEDVQEMAKGSFSIEESNPFVTWIAGDYAESDKPNSNTQFWTTDDLSMAEYTIKHAPLNMVHKFRTPVGFFAATNKVKISSKNDQAKKGDRVKIQALAGLWSHIFPVEDTQARAADAAGALFFSMECRADKIKCAGPNGCQEEFAYGDPSSHCDHLMERSSIRHLIKPVFRGGALIIPPVKPGWKQAYANVVDSSELREQASAYAEQHEKQFRDLAGSGITASQWEATMALVMSSTQR